MDFPAIECDTRSYTLPGMPASSVAGHAGVRIDFRHGRRTVDGPISITFRNVSLSTANTIRDHYLTQKQYNPFAISEELWDGHVGLNDVNPWDVQYRYASPPQRSITEGGLYNVTIELTTMLQPWA